MCGTLASFTAMAVAGRELSDTISPFEIAFFRAAGGLVIVLPLLGTMGFGQLRTRRLPIHFTRNLFHFGAQVCWFTGVSLLPIATVFAVEFTIPMWTAALAVLFIGERLNRGRITAIVLGFAGVLIIVQPGTAVFDPAVFFVVAAAFGFAVSNVATKVLAPTESTLTIIFYMNLIQTPLGLAASSFDWTWPVLADTPWIVLVGVGGFTAHFCLTRAFRLADASLILPIDYLRLPLAAVIGYILYQESVGLALYVGALFIIAGNYYNIRFESRRLKTA